MRVLLVNCAACLNEHTEQNKGLHYLYLLLTLARVCLFPVTHGLRIRIQTSSSICTWGITQGDATERYTIHRNLFRWHTQRYVPRSAKASMCVLWQTRVRIKFELVCHLLRGCDCSDQSLFYIIFFLLQGQYISWMRGRRRRQPYHHHGTSVTLTHTLERTLNWYI